MTVAALLTVVEVPKEDRVLCGARGCGHTVYRRIHVVQDGAALKVLGSDSFKRLYGHLEPSAATPRYGGSEGRTLTGADRAMLVDNTQRFVDQLEVERLQVTQQALDQRAVNDQQAADRQETNRQRFAALKARLRFADWVTDLTPTERETFDRWPAGQRCHAQEVQHRRPRSTRLGRHAQPRVPDSVQIDARVADDGCPQLIFAIRRPVRRRPNTQKPEAPSRG